MNRKRLAFFDCSRALCMLYIVAVYHITVYLPSFIPISLHSRHCIAYGTLATFFFISAYFLGKCPICSIGDTLFFLKKRLLRIYPLYFIACTLMLVVSLALNVSYMTDIKQYLLTILGLSTIFTPAPYTLWFISMLIVYYLITPLVNALQTQQQKAFLCIGLLILVFILYSAGIPIDPRLSLYLPIYIGGLMLSACKDLSAEFNLWALLISAAAFTIGVAINARYDDMFFQYFVSLPFIVMILEIGKLAAMNSILCKSLSLISYSSMVAYMFHRQYFILFYSYFGELPIWATYLILLPVLLALSWLVQYAYDRLINKIA